MGEIENKVAFVSDKIEAAIRKATSDALEDSRRPRDSVEHFNNTVVQLTKVAQTAEQRELVATFMSSRLEIDKLNANEIRNTNGLFV